MENSRVNEPLETLWCPDKF